jgi:hypothetical protein
MDLRILDTTVPDGQPSPPTTQSDRESLSASDIEMVSLVSALENSDQTHNADGIDDNPVAGVLDPSATLDTSKHLPREQIIDKRSKAVSAVPDQRPSTYSRLILETWTCETVAMLFSIACIVAIAFTVGHYNGDSIPSLPSGVTLNALISILSTAARAALFFVLSSSIGQLKWCWLVRRGARLQDLQVMDRGSRGPLGAIKVLATWVGGPLASLGAAITICMIAFSPFLQQLVAYPTYSVEQPCLEATMPQVVNYTLLWDFEKDGDLMIRWPLSSLLDAWVRPPEASTDFFYVPTTSSPIPICSRPATCRWEDYKSIGWCSKCRNTTGYLSDCVVKDHRSNNLSETRSDPFCQLFVNKSGTEPTRQHGSIRQYLTSDYSKVRLRYDADYLWKTNISTFVADDHTVIEQPVVMYTHAAISHVEDVFRDLYHSDQPALQIHHISECVVTLCERKYAITVKDGVTSSDLISTDYGRRSQSGSCWQPEHSAEDAVLTSPDGGHTRINQTERAFCPVGIYYDVFETKLDNSTYTWFYNLTDSHQKHGVPPPAPADYGLNMSNHNAIGMAYLPEAKVLVR